MAIFGGRSSSRLSSGLRLRMAPNGIRLIIPSDPSRFLGSRPIRPIWGHRALSSGGASGVVLLSGKSPKAKTFERPGSRQFYFFSTHVKYSLSDSIIKCTNMGTRPFTEPATDLNLSARLSDSTFPKVTTERTLSCYCVLE